MESLSPPPPYHIVLFPFMSKGHTIPLIDVAHLLLCRGHSLTIFTTPKNSPFLHRSLSSSNVVIVDLSVPGCGVESTDKLSVTSHFLQFLESTRLLQPAFEQAIEAFPHVDCMITDGFLGWTQQSASKFGIPRLVFYGMSAFAMTISSALTRDRPHKDLASDDESFSLSCFPWIRLTKSDFDQPFCNPEPKGPLYDFIIELTKATMESRGIVVNSFYELEPAFVDYWNREFGPRAWCVGPFCLAKPKAEPLPHEEKSIWMQWLDARLGEKRPVLYVAFGSQAEVSDEQLLEISIGLERSEVDFLWVVRSKVSFDGGYEERVQDRGLVVREWVEQREILGHESVKGFLSHCGWNSVMESVCADVPILAWPLMAEQGLNAKMVVEELGIGLRLGARDGSLVSWESVEKMVRELMVAQKGKAVAEKAKEVGEMARRAMEGSSGSSWQTLDRLIHDCCCSSTNGCI